MSIKWFFVFLSVSLFLMGGCAQTAKVPHHSSLNDPPVSTLNRVLEDLQFAPINGPAFRFSDLKSAKAIVIVMREKDCPISEKYGLRLARMEEEYTPKGIHFIYNYVGLVKTNSSASSDLKDFGFKGPYVIDDQRKIVDALGARTTGDVFVLTPERRVIYRGPVDDQYHLLKAAPNVKNHYLQDLFENIVSGQAIQPIERPAPGCLISRPMASLAVFFKDSIPYYDQKMGQKVLFCPDSEELKPDMVFSLPEPVKISPTRSFVYKTFLKPTDFPQDRWIKDIRFSLKPKVIHHAAVYIMDSAYRPSSGGLDHHTKAFNIVRHTEFKSAYPLRGKENTSSVGIRVPRGAKLLWEIHYEPLGRVLIDKHTKAEIYFHREKPKYELLTHYYYTPDLRIPPHVSDYMVKRSYRAKKTILLAGLNVHMHLRGKAASVFLTDLVGQRKRIFGLDPFHPYYESFYRFEKPLKVDKGSIVECRTWFDNSLGNPKNPSPDKSVVFGWSLEDEMSNCVFKELVPVSRQAKKHLFITPFEPES